MDALLRSCTGKAYEAIQCCRLLQPASAGLQRALAILEEEFGKSKMVAQAHLREISEGPVVAATLEGLNRLYRSGISDVTRDGKKCRI